MVKTKKCTNIHSTDILKICKRIIAIKNYVAGVTDQRGKGGVKKELRKGDDPMSQSSRANPKWKKQYLINTLYQNAEKRELSLIVCLRWTELQRRHEDFAYL